MAFSNSNDYLTGRKPAPTSSDSDVVAVRYAVSLTASDLTANNVGAVGILPAGYVPVALFVDADDLDAGATPTIAMSVGVLNAAGNDISTAASDGGAAWGSSITVAQNGGQVAVNSKALARVVAASTDRKIGVKITTAPATAQAGEIGVTVLYRAA